MSKTSNRIETSANIAIIVVAVLIAGVLARNYFFPPRPPSLPQIAVGTKVALQGFDWAKSNQTLLVVLQQGCHFCSESAPFYRRLVEETSGRQDVRLVAVLPQESGAGRQYLNGLGVPIEDVRQAPLNSIEVRGTPTLILVDSKGTVKNSWIGKLPPEKEKEVLELLRPGAVASGQASPRPATIGPDADPHARRYSFTSRIQLQG